MRTKALLIAASIVSGVGCGSKSGTLTSSVGSADGGTDLPDARPEAFEASSDAPPEVPADAWPDGDSEVPAADGGDAGLLLDAYEGPPTSNDDGPQNDSGDGGAEAPSTISNFCDSISQPIGFACSFYCLMLSDNCGEDQYDCEAACEVPTWECGVPGDRGVNTVFCRAGHAQAAATAADPTIECANAGPNSSDCR